ncbi:MAG: c-type cytochrome [Pirellulales bacterium]|nr:c-type cytochrome [Pirellulales bacterium]
MIAIALLANHFLLQGGDVPPPGALDAPAEKAVVEEPAKEKAASKPATEAVDEESAAHKVADEVQATGDSGETAPASPATQDVVAEAPIAPVGNPAEETILLGEDDLTAGVPGEGDLTLDEIRAWVSDAKNHVVLKPQLPLGLDAGAGEVQGLDENPLTRAKIELGRQLFFDPRLSKDGTISCASCHDPEFGYAKDTQFGVGIAGQTGNRNSPVAYNRILSGAQFWDGRASSVEEQAVGPIANPIEMGHEHEACVAQLREIPGYVAQFDAAFPGIGLTLDGVAQAIASFERTLVTGPAPWDHYQALKSFEQAYAEDLEPEYLGEFEEDDPEAFAQYQALKAAAEANPISASAIRGGEIFFSNKGGCTACHVGANFTDEKYHNLGVGMDADEPDLGRYVVTEVEADKGAFKTPTVRNVALTAPYMHDGSQQTLEEVVEWYAKGGHPNPWLSDKVLKLELADQDKADLVAFMKEGLTSKLPKVERGRLPE